MRRDKTPKSMNVTRGHHPRNSSQRAFTLMELLLVMTIMTILAGIAVPRFANSLALQRLDGAARRVMADLKFAQGQAKISSASHKVAFDVGNDSYYLQSYDSAASQWYFLASPDHPSLPYEVRLGDDPYQAAIIAVRFGALQEIVFDGYGMPTSSGAIYLQVGGNIKKVSVESGTGSTEVRFVDSVDAADDITPLPPDKTLEVK